MWHVLQLSLQLLGAIEPRLQVERPSGLQALPQVQDESTSTTIPDYFDIDNSAFAGPTRTGSAPWLAQTNIAPFPGVSYIPNAPLETQIPIAGNIDDQNIFQSLGHLSPYLPNPRGFGVNEYPIPSGSNVSWLNMVHRHGSRYPEVTGTEFVLGQKIMSQKGNFTASGPVEFLNYYEFLLGAEILVPVGKQQLFDSGTLHYYNYGHLYPNNGSKIVARSTTQRRMTESAEYFLAGFFGLGWQQNATLERIIESDDYNNTMAGYKMCNHSNWEGAAEAQRNWTKLYLQDAHHRIASNISGVLGSTWTLEDTYNAQALCAYETVALGFSPWCGVFTFAEWQGFEYSLDILFSSGNGFGSPVGRATGVGYVEEVLARMQHHVITSSASQINITLDNNTATFPVDQTLNLDFSHDANIIAILAAFGLTQFAGSLPLDRVLPDREFVMSFLQPFAGRLDIEVVNAPRPVNANRSDTQNVYEEGGPTSYVHFLLNQRTVPLGRSLEECGLRDDGWCEMGTFLEVQKRQIALADYDFACWGDYEDVGYGEVTNGRPVGR
ncbi:phosphoglycerate mutase-like protein [Lophiostoma macrostomum CBS 122681]|uniref:3-phytase n=1 Tax=Lophiostoma macrostomum CBS 122681 TaxID=1314788 RepID=A0A6A6TQZ9_9PLEO|nr:phosphoglycerate mutase-like protein [Lophiostoma macrostomum CBS 122681]